jgi:hypothetical protein
MLKINSASLIKAATVGVVLAGLLYLISLTPFFNNILTVLLLAGVVIIPVGVGMYYGYLAPGHETMGQSIIGGGISGLIAGLILGFAFGLNAFVMSTAPSFLGSMAAGAGTTLIIGGLFGAFGAVMGAIGGVIWKFVQPAESA